MNKFAVGAATGLVLAVLGVACTTPGDASSAILWTKPLVETDRYIGWPSAIRTAKGETIAVYSGDRDQHICPFGKVQMIRSADDGETWTKPVTVCDGPIDDRDAGLLELPNGDLVLFWFTSVAFAEGEPNRAKYRAECERTTDAEKRAALGSWARRSTDGGQTWSEPVRVPVMTPHGGVLLRDGRILVVGVSNYMTAGRLPRDLVRPAKTYGVAESTDGGRAFRLIGEVPRGQIAEHWSLGEPTLFESRDGVLHALFRYELDENGAWQKKTNMLRSESRDGGKTWTPMRRMEIDGFPPHILRLMDGRLLCSYANRTPGRVGVYACFSSDDGRTFDVAHETRLFSSGDNDLGYATTVENADGTFLTVFYAHGASGGPAKLFGTKWRER